MLNIGQLKSLLAICLIIVSNALFAVEDMSQQTLLDKLKDDGKPLVLDVRTVGEYESGHVPGAVNIDHRQLADRLAELGGDKSREVVVYCEAGVRADYAGNRILLNPERQISQNIDSLHITGSYVFNRQHFHQPPR